MVYDEYYKTKIMVIFFVGTPFFSAELAATVQLFVPVCG